MSACLSSVRCLTGCVAILLLSFFNCSANTDDSLGSRCPWPHSVWCSSPIIAAQCQVEKACHSNVWRPKPQSTAYPPVRIGLYIESLCPDCRDFVKKQLYRAFTEVGSITNFTIVPFGNARESWNESIHRWDFRCQHGKPECIGNVIEACVINLYPDPAKHLKFIYCMETADQYPEQIYRQCAKVAKIDDGKIQKCYTSKQGNTYEHEMALKTPPEHQYVPWVTLNGVHSEQIQDHAENDLVKLICDTYVGPKPHACTRKKARQSMNDWL